MLFVWYFKGPRRIVKSSKMTSGLSIGILLKMLHHVETPIHLSYMGMHPVNFLYISHALRDYI